MAEHYTERLEVRCDPSLKQAVEALADKTHTKAAQITRTALREYLAKHGEKAA